MAKFEPGQSGNPKGRPPGQSEDIKRIRAILTDIVDGNLETLKEDIAGLKPIQRLQIVEKLLRYVLPPPPAENILDGLSNDDLDYLIQYITNKTKSNE